MNTGDSSGCFCGLNESLFFAALQSLHTGMKWENKNATRHKAAQSSLKTTKNAGNEH